MVHLNDEQGGPAIVEKGEGGAHEHMTDDHQGSPRVLSLCWEALLLVGRAYASTQFRAPARMECRLYGETACVKLEPRLEQLCYFVEWTPVMASLKKGQLK